MVSGSSNEMIMGLVVQTVSNLGRGYAERDPISDAVAFRDPADPIKYWNDNKDEGSYLIRKLLLNKGTLVKRLTDLLSSRTNPKLLNLGRIFDPDIVAGVGMEDLGVRVVGLYHLERADVYRVVTEPEIGLGDLDQNISEVDYRELLNSFRNNRQSYGSWILWNPENAKAINEFYGPYREQVLTRRANDAREKASFLATILLALESQDVRVSTLESYTDSIIHRMMLESLNNIANNLVRGIIKHRGYEIVDKYLETMDSIDEVPTSTLIKERDGRWLVYTDDNPPYTIDQNGYVKFNIPGKIIDVAYDLNGDANGIVLENNKLYLGDSFLAIYPVGETNVSALRWGFEIYMEKVRREALRQVLNRALVKATILGNRKD